MTIQAALRSSTKHANIPIPRVLPRSTRRKIEDAIEKHIAARDALIDFLDQCDGDADLEPSADYEPSLGWSLSGGCGGTDDLETDDADRESNFSWSERIDQTGLLNGSEMAVL